MELFVEQKNKNYGMIYDLLMELEQRSSKIMTSSEILELVSERGIYTSYFVESLLNKREDETENFHILKEVSPNIYASNMETVFPPPMLEIERIYLRSVLDDNRMKIFLDDSTISKLKEALRTCDDFEIGRHIQLLLHLSKMCSRSSSKI